jgi:hypothetical protein
MKNRISAAVLIPWKTIPILTGLLLFAPVFAKAQTVGTWSFAGTLAGTGTANNTVSAASLGPGIDTSAFLSGVYYGEGNWPSGGLDPNYYLQFSLTPNSGHELSLSGISLNIRRSTTGTAAGSGPNNWSIRSSLDGFATDIATGGLALSTSPTLTVALGTAFASLSTTVTFRLYGFNQVTTASGFDRFCYQNITVSGLIVLPVILESFNAALLPNKTVQLEWALNGEIAITSMQVERSTDGLNFISIQDVHALTSQSDDQYSYEDVTVSSFDQNLYYRIKMIDDGNNINYSEVREIILTGKNALSLTPLPVHAGGTVAVKVNADQSDNYHFYLFSISGMQVAAKTIALNSGSQYVQMDNAGLHTGLYLLTAERSGEKVTTKIMVQ